jgi:thioesterase domain-containing protein
LARSTRRPENSIGPSRIHERQAIRESQEVLANHRFRASRFSVQTMTASTLVEMLTTIWQRVLRLPSVGVDDNFFDVGGDSALALELFHEIALVCGRELPPVMIYHAPTIAALAAVLEQPATPRVPPLVQLRAGSIYPPVFIAHGLGGSVMDFFQVVKHVQTGHAIHGMQARGIDGIDDPFDRIEDMARYSLTAVRELQPRGPYFLIGFSLGGLIVLEMAQQLIAQGEEIGLLAMLDSYPHVGRLSRGERLRLSIRQTWRRVARRMQWLGVAPPYQTKIDTVPSPNLLQFRESSYRALEQYQPQFYPGKMNFVRAAIPTDFPADPRAVWSKLTREFELTTVPGDHLGIMTTHFESLATVISDLLSESIRG